MTNKKTADDPLQFAALIAHQIKSPVGAAGSLLKTVLGEYVGQLTDRQKDILTRADKRIEDAIDTVSRLLSIVRAEQEAREGEASAEAAALIHRVMEKHGEEARGRKIDLRATILREPVHLQMAEAALAEALGSLISNAMKYTPDNGIISVRLDPVEGETHARIVIEDSGIGVPEEQKDKIFEPFYRTESARKTALPGLGLGLAFVRALVDAVGGTIHVERSPLGGASFVMRIPRLDLEAGAVRREEQDNRLKVVIIGGMAAGPKVAAKVIRLNPDAFVTIIEKRDLLSIAGCGLPYYIAGVVKESKELLSTPLGAVRDAVFFMNLKNVHVRNRTEALEIDRAGKRVLVRDDGSGEESWLAYDKLVIATGASAVIPPIEGLRLRNIFTLHGVAEAEKIRTLMAARKAKDVVIVGGGLIGIEMTEALVMQGCRVTIVEARDQIWYRLDWEIAKLLEQYMESRGVRILTDTKVLSCAGTDAVESVITDRGDIACDMVILGIGVQPNVELARRARLEIGTTGAIKVDSRMLTTDPDIYAAGDCVENTDILTGHPCFVPLGSTANKQGRVVAVNICGGNDTFPGVLGSTICKVFDYCAGRTGLSEADALRAGYDPVAVLSASLDREHFMPDAQLLMLKLIVDRRTRLLLGLQILGPGEGAKRLDVAATAITAGMTVDRLATLDLCYAPPYSLAMDNLITAANIARNKLENVFQGIPAREVREWQKKGKTFTLLDVSTPWEHDAYRIPGSILIPLSTLRARMGELPRERDIVVYCRLAIRGYEAALVLQAAGFERVRVMDGGSMMWPYERLS